MGIEIGVNTVTFRALDLEDVVSLLADSGVHLVEWAGGARVPPGDLNRASQARELCEEAGLSIASYGSYYRCDRGGPSQGPFQFDKGAGLALETCLALGARSLRVWAGRMGSEEGSADYRQEVAEEMRSLCDRAAEKGVQVHLEFHRNTLADRVESVLDLLDQVKSSNLSCYWQPRHGYGVEAGVSDIRDLGGRLSNLHVFNWRLVGEKQTERLPLGLARDRWQRYLAAASRIGGDRIAFIEFVKGDSQEQYYEDLAVLRDLLANLDGGVSD